MKKNSHNQKQEIQRSRAFRATRAHHSTEAAEDYCELIAELSESQGEARTCEIAGLLGISHVAALKTIRRLQSEGYVETSPYRPVVLTDKGRKIARSAKERHELLVSFFVSIGVPHRIAEIDVEGAEHHISEQTLQAVRRFMNNTVR